MNVSDLIAELEQYRPDAEVIIDGHGDCDWRPLRTAGPCFHNGVPGGGVFLTSVADEDDIEPS